MRAIDYFDKGADANSERTAIVDRESRYTYREMREITHRIARAMKANGLNGEERAAIYSPNDARVLICMLGILRAGAVWVPINSRNAPEANAEYMAYAEVSWLFYHSSYREQVDELKARVPTLRHFICIDAEDGLNPSLDKFTDSGSASASEEIDWGDSYGNPDRLMGLVPTGGTTGAAKGVMVTDLSWGTMTEMAGQYWAGETTDRVCLTSAPLSHAAGVVAFVMTTLGATNVVMPGFDALEVGLVEQSHRRVGKHLRRRLEGCASLRLLAELHEQRRPV